MWCLLLLGVPAAGFAIGAVGSWRTDRKEKPAKYDDSDYARRDAPHGDDYAVGAVCAVLSPIVIALFVVSRIGDAVMWLSRRRWEAGRTRRAVRAAEEAERLDMIAKADEIIAELTGRPGPFRANQLDEVTRLRDQLRAGR